MTRSGGRHSGEHLAQRTASTATCFARRRSNLARLLTSFRTTTTARPRPVEASLEEKSNPHLVNREIKSCNVSPFIACCIRRGWAHYLAYLIAATGHMAHNRKDDHRHDIPKTLLKFSARILEQY
ncbi:hypothetical protein [Bradyrhizobium lablabi]|uniref:hypothetical protein n=1 Tax=Bradyrhizobium lablabi TaxID=722472 RepID=UPI001BAD975C|nr:hypothetical protein [Bradyrhizobium lablabi]MBR0694309.1 hypothetical protein [Bradyrhizobium lablabi]